MTMISLLCYFKPGILMDQYGLFHVPAFQNKFLKSEMLAFLQRSTSIQLQKNNSYINNYAI
jgi:hypothetical protein